jgi:hypothetical protein
MKRATIELPDELSDALTAYGRDRGVGTELDDAVDVALRDLLESHGYLVLDRPFRPLRIAPVAHEGEETDISINHDWSILDGADLPDPLPFRPFHITPLHRDDGPTDISKNHDRYIADGETSGSR